MPGGLGELEHEHRQRPRRGERAPLDRDDLRQVRVGQAADLEWLVHWLRGLASGSSQVLGAARPRGGIGGVPRAPAGRRPAPRTTWARDPAGATRTPAASRTSPNRTDPSPAASGSAPASRTRARATSSGVAANGRPCAPALALVERREHLAAAGRRSAAGARSASMPGASAASDDTGRSSRPCASRERAGGGHADPQAGERRRGPRRPPPRPGRPSRARRRPAQRPPRGMQLGGMCGPAAESAPGAGSRSKASPSARSTHGGAGGVEVSRPSTFTSISIRAPVAARVLEPHPRGHPRQRVLRDLGPLDEADPLGRQVVVQQLRVLAGQRPSR